MSGNEQRDTMRGAVIYDCEFLTAEGAHTRYWAGPGDPDPLLIEIGAVHLSLEPGFRILSTFQTLVRPRDRFGTPVALDPFVTTLTGITAEEFAEDAIPLKEALSGFAAFCGQSPIWSWGKDEIYAFALSCYVGGFASPIPASQCRNACGLMLKAGMHPDKIAGLRSGQLARHFGLAIDDLTEHRGLGDAMSVARTLSFLLSEGRLTASDFA